MSKVFLVILAIGFLFGSCKEEPRVYHRTAAIKTAHVKLAKYAEQERLELAKFKGPYTRPAEETSHTSYDVCYLHPEYYFCYTQFTDESWGILKRDTYPDNATIKWLHCLDPYGPDWITPETP